MTASPPPILAMEAVSKTFPAARAPVTVLQAVTFALEPGEFVAITGPSGSGKTTLLNLAALLDRPTSGQVWFRGQDVSRLGDTALNDLRRRRVGMVFQRFCLLSHRTVLENVLFRFRYLDLPGTEALDLARAALADMGLSQHAGQPARLLSGGEMQRTAIARAVALPPDLLLVDEPTGNLDATAANEVMRCFETLNRRGITILLATHNAALLKYCRRRLICRDGTVAACPVTE